MTLSGAITQGLRGPGIDGYETVLLILQSSRITGASLSDCLMSFLGNSFFMGWEDLPFCRDAFGPFYSATYTHYGIQSVFSKANLQGDKCIL